MSGSPPGENSDARWRAALSLFDRNPDPALDEITRLAAELCGAEFAYIGWIEADRLWFKARSGFDGAEQPASSSACRWTIVRGVPQLIEDAALDPRFPPQGIPLGAAHCRSYAGAPLMAAREQVVGTLAVLSREPGKFHAEQLKWLEVLARQAMTRLELYSRIRSQERAQQLRQKMERAFELERCVLTATLDSFPAMIAVLDKAGRIVRMNEACARATGLRFADATGRSFLELFLETEDRVWAAPKLREAAAGQASGPYETPWKVAGIGFGHALTPDSPDSVRRVSWILRPVAGPEGSVEYLIVSGHDVTSRRVVEKALLSSEERYREMVENSLGIAFACSLEGRLTAINPVTAETLGLRSEDLIGRAVMELMDAVGASAFQNCLRRLRAQEEWHGSLQLRRGDGMYRRVSLRSRLVEIPGEPPLVINHGMDVTEQHAIEEALQLAQRQRQLILESAGDGIYGIDLEGRLTFINEAGARALGYTPDQLAGLDVHEVIHHSHADGTSYSKLTNPILRALRRREQIRMRGEVFWRRDGTAIPVEYSANPLMEEGRISGMVVAFQDVSERRRLEKMKDEFISTVSHELRTPLTSLRASLGLVSSGSLVARPEKQRHMLEIAISNCERLIRLVNDILDFDSVEKGKLPLHRQPVEAVDLLRRAADTAREAAGRAGIVFRIDARSAPVFADEERMLQVLHELLTNAIKFSGPETTIRLTAQPAGRNASGSNEVCFAIEDQGSGIDPEKLDRIFERFLQGDSSDTRAMGGTGLGLALCRSIVEQHGGRIWAESEIGKGSRFLFTLPAASLVEAG
ncbi:MAG TPA: PAS domain S-box protein [Terracidiphilus sp.]|nr:PAS domain S-box protein [Terracidiphilus sp.]